MIKLVQNLDIKILSLAAAFFLWIFVVGIENSVYKFPDALAIQAVNLDSNVSLAADLPTVRLYLKDDKDIIPTLTKNDFTISADFSNLKSGQYTVPISAVAKNPQVRILKVEPNQVSVKLSPSAEKDIKIVANITGKTAAGYEAKDYKLEFETAKILGAQVYLDQINNLEANLVLNGTETEDLSQNISLSLPEKNNAIGSNIQIVPPQVLINLRIVPKLDQKKFTIQPVPAGVDNSAVWVKLIKIFPASVQVEGDEKTIKSLETLNTKPIDIQQLLNQTGTFKVDLDMPAGVNVVGGTNSVSVSIKDETTERKTMAVPVVLTGKAEGVNVTKVTPSSINVTLSGTSSLVNNLKAGDVTVSIDISKINSLGPVQIQNQDIKVPLGLKVMDYRPGDITLE